MDLDGYIRVSRVAGREGESFISPDVQRERISALAASQGHSIAAWHEDLDLTGHDSKRPGLQEALERIDQGESGGIIVWKLSRFGRSASDIHRNLERLRSAGGELLTVEESINTSGAFGRFLLTIMAGLAELEWEQRREGWETARERAVGRGVHISSRTPTGYLKGEGGRLAIDPSAGPAVAAAFRARAEGGSWRELGLILEDAGVETSYGGVNWSAQSLKAMLANRVYLGEARSGEFVNSDAHEPLVDAATFQLAQRTEQRPGGGTGGALLSGLLRCAGCSFSMKPDHMRARSGEKVRIYRCRGSFSRGRCESRASALGSVIEPWVVEQFFDRIGDLRLLGYTANVELAEATRRRDAAEAEVLAYRDSEAASILGDRFADGLRERVSAVEEAAIDVARLMREQGLAEVPDVVELLAVWDELETGERREILSAGIEHVFLRSVGQRNTPVGDRALIRWLGEGPEGLPSLKVRNFTPRPFTW